MAALKNPRLNEVGTVICNPPYGERLGTTPALIALLILYLGKDLKRILRLECFCFLVANPHCLIV